MSANLLDGITPALKSGTTESDGIYHHAARTDTSGHDDWLYYDLPGQPALSANQIFHVGLSTRGASANSASLHATIGYGNAAGETNWAISDPLPIGTSWGRAEATIVVPSGMTLFGFFVSPWGACPETWMASPTLSYGSTGIVMAAGSVTIASITDVASTTRYYLLQSSTLTAPAAPTANPPGGSWQVTEPTYSESSTNSLYICDQTVFSDGTWSYSSVSLSSSYDAAKAAYNKAAAAAAAADAATSAATAPTHRIVSNCSSISQDPSGECSPATLSCKAWATAAAADGTTSDAAYAGRWKVEASADGSTWTSVSTSSTDASTLSQGMAAVMSAVDGAAYVRVTLFAAGGTTTQLAQETLSVVQSTGSYVVKNANGLWVTNTAGDLSGANAGITADGFHVRDGSADTAEFLSNLIKLLSGAFELSVESGTNSDTGNTEDVAHLKSQYLSLDGEGTAHGFSGLCASSSTGGLEAPMALVNAQADGTSQADSTALSNVQINIDTGDTGLNAEMGVYGSGQTLKQFDGTATSFHTAALIAADAVQVGSAGDLVPLSRLATAIQPVVLYNGGAALYYDTAPGAGTTGTVTLSESAANFSKLKIFFRTDDNAYGSYEVPFPNGKRVGLSANWSTGTSMWYKARAIDISGTSITTVEYGNVNSDGSSFSHTNVIYIVRVEGIR